MYYMDDLDIMVTSIYKIYFIYACYHNIFVFIFRWGSTVSCLDSIQKNKQTLKTLGLSENSRLYSATKGNILSDVFCDKVDFFKIVVTNS